MRVVNRVDIEELGDPRVAGYRALQTADLRGSERFVVEGRLNVQQLIASPFSVESVFVTPAAHEALQPSLAKLPAETPVYVASKAVLSGVVGFVMHRGCVALAQRGDPVAADTLRSAREGRGLVLVLEDLTDQENVGGCFRNAMAFGVDGVLLSPRCCDPLLRKATRVSMGGTLRIPFARVDDWPKGLSQLADAGFARVALHPRSGSAELETLAASLGDAPVALVVGSEGPGMSDALLQQVDHHVHIRMAAGVDSLNVATAAAIALHAFAAQRLAEPSLR